jgi:predicted  nucleic acid-binding Zn-ribbon protein/SAM-dependent methyltransferase
MKETPLFSVRRGLEAVVRFLYLEPLLPGKDVLVVAGGDPDDAPKFLARLGVRSAAHAQPPERAPLPSDMAALRGRAEARSSERRGLSYRDGAFDVVFVPEVADLPDPGLLFQEVARVLQPGGVLLAATRNASCLSPIAVPPEGGHAEVWTYSRLRALLATFFPSVRMVGQGPFLGYTFVEYDPRAIPDVRLDTTLLEGRGEDPEFFIGVCTRAVAAELPLPALFQVPLQEFTVAEVPADERGEAAPPSESAALAALAVEEALAESKRDVERLKAELAERNVMIARLEQEVKRAEGEAADARERSAKLAKSMEGERKAEQRKAFDATFARAAQLVEITPPPPLKPAGSVPEVDDLVVRRLRDDLEDKRREAEQLRHAADEAKGKLADAERRIADVQRRAKEAEERARKAVEPQARIDELTRKIAEAERKVGAAEQAHVELAEAERALRVARDKLAVAEKERELAVGARQAAEGEAHKQVDAVERRLQEQGRRVAELEHLAEDRRRLVEDLLRELRHQPVEAAVPPVPESVPPPEEASPEDDSIAEAWATAVGEVDMLRTAVAQLEGELTGARWRNAELHTAVAELLEETQDAEAEAERLRGALEIAQVAAEEATRALAERDGESASLRADVERLAPLAEQATEVSRLVDELRRQAVDLKAILEAREAELAKFRASGSAPGAAAEALAARLDMLRGAVDAVHERLARLREDPRAYAVVSDLDDIGTALHGALNASG